MMVESQDLIDLPEKGEAVYINKAGDRIAFMDGMLNKEPAKAGSKDKTISVP